MSKDFDDEFESLLRESARVAAEYDASEEDDHSDQSQELSERHALRRVQGFSTELQDISEAEYRQLQLERVVLVGVWTEGTIKDAENSLAELKALAETAGSRICTHFQYRFPLHRLSLPASLFRRCCLAQ